MKFYHPNVFFIQFGGTESKTGITIRLEALENTIKCVYILVYGKFVKMTLLRLNQFLDMLHKFLQAEFFCVESQGI